MKPVYLGFALLALGLNACQHIENHQTVGEARLPVVMPVETRMDVDMDKNIAKQFRMFLQRHEIHNNDDLVIYAPANLTDFEEKQIRKAQRYMEKQNLNHFIKSSQGDEMQIGLVRYHVRVPRCPDWSNTPGRDYNNQLNANFGCANASNLALMIANPKDLIVGRNLTAPDAARLSTTIQNYRLPTSTVTTSAEGE